MMGFEVGVREESSADSLEPGVRDGQEDAADVNDVSGVHLSSKRAADMDGHGARNMANWNLIGLYRVLRVDRQRDMEAERGPTIS